MIFFECGLLNTFEYFCCLFNNRNGNCFGNYLDYELNSLHFQLLSAFLLFVNCRELLFGINMFHYYCITLLFIVELFYYLFHAEKSRNSTN